RALAHQATELTGTGVVIAREGNIDGLQVVHGRMDPDRIASMRTPLAQASVALKQSHQALAGIRSPWLLGPLADRAQSLDPTVRHGVGAVATAAIGVDVLPQLLGTTGPQRYFLMFTTPSEARATSGFMGNWGVITVTDGHFELTRFGRTAELNDAGD